MIKSIRKFNKVISIFLLQVFMLCNLQNNVYAFPGGPSQPEATGFSPVGNTEMVNKFNGQFSYNIPLMDVGGYPINIAYNADLNNDMEASWVGLGWSLNTGSINRLKRGLPDDFKGDVIEREANRKNIFKVAVSRGVGGQIYNVLEANLTRGLYYKSNVGWGTEASMSLGLGYKGLGLNFTRESNDEDGVTSSFGASYSLNVSNKITGSTGLGVSYGETSNSRQGLMNRSWGVALTKQLNVRGMNVGSINAGYNSNKSFIEIPRIPSCDLPFNTYSGTFSLKVGADGVGFDVNGTLSGHFMLQSFNTNQNTLSHKSYGYLYSDIGSKDENALLDFSREKDAPYHSKIPNLSVPQNTYDLFSINQHNGGGQFRAYRNGLGIMRDPYFRTTEDDVKIGAEVHFGALVEAGADVGYTNTSTKGIGKESKGGQTNTVFTNIDFNSKIQTNPVQEEFYFKKLGELEEKDLNFENILGGDNPVSLSLIDVFKPYSSFRGEKFENKFSEPVSKFYSLEKVVSGSGFYKRPNNRNTNISFKTISQKNNTSLDKNLVSFKKIDMSTMDNNPEYLESQIVDQSKIKEHHISEFNITNEDGSIYNYGLPLYNIIQEDVTFTANSSKQRDANNLVEYTSGTDDSKSNSSGLDGYFNKEVTPPYAHSWLLTSIVSDDYMDMTNDGITDDDRGTAVKFNYTKAGNYSWRNPVNNDLKQTNKAAKASYYEGVEYHNNDNRGNYSYGIREEWYNHSIESKTMIAFFLTKERKDALPLDSKGDFDNISVSNGTIVKKKYLDEIILYSKAEISKILKSNPTAKMGDIIGQGTPIKRVKFEYDYSLCSKNPMNENNYLGNSDPNKGKLTLKAIKIYSGKNLTPLSYKFDYGNTATDNPDFNSNNYDRWGNYKKEKLDNNLFAPGLNLENSKFPYSVQDKMTAYNNVQAWLLKKITLPSGGEIKVNYESNTYSYVQDKRTATMYKIVGLGNSTNQNFINNNKLYSNGIFNNYLFFETNIPKTTTLTTQNVKDLFFEDLNNKDFKQFIFYKTYVELANGKSEPIPGYARIDDIGLYTYGSNDKHVVWVKLGDIKGYGAISVNSWQFIRDNIPQIAYEGYPELEFKPLSIAYRLLSNMAKIFTGEKKFEDQAIQRGLAQKITLGGRSYVRALIPNQTKYGGGARVSRITLTDRWDDLVNPPNYIGASRNPNIKTPEPAEYTIDYEYDMLNENKEKISSGVATYEPLVGGEENPWRMPVFYQSANSDKTDMLGLSPEGPATQYSLEKPFGESLFPNASIGYSYVKVTTNKSKSATLNSGNGFKEFEYYTAKDYPILVENTYLDPDNTRYEKSDDGFSIKMVLGGEINRWDRRAASQGYSVVLNDMHGKPKSERFYKYGGALFSSSVFEYKSTENLLTMGSDGIIQNRSYADNTDFTIDVRSMSTDVSALSAGVGGGYAGIPPFGWGWGVPAPPKVIKDEKWLKLYSTSKLVNKSNVMYKTTVNKDGAVYTTDHLLWDSKTLDPIVSSTNNEFNQTVYSYNLPGYFVYDKLGQSFQNQGIELSLGTSTINSTTGAITGVSGYLQNGDEVLLTNTTITGTPEKLYVLKTSSLTTLIRNNGSTFIPVANSNYKLYVYHSSYKNNLSGNVMNITSMVNPILGSGIRNNFASILSASASEYKDAWPLLVKSNLSRSGQTPTCLSSWAVNPFRTGNAEYWKPFRSFKPLGLRKDISGSNSTPNLFLDGNSNNGIDVFYYSNGNQFIKNTNISMWNSQSENSIYDTKGNLVEDLQKVSKFGICK